MDILYYLQFFIDNVEIIQLSNFSVMLNYFTIILLFFVLFFKNKIQIPIVLQLLFFYLFINSCYNLVFGNASFKEVIKQFLGITIFSITLFSYISQALSKYQLKVVVDLYIKAAFILSILGLMEEFIQLVGFSVPQLFFITKGRFGIYMSEFGLYRINSIFLEPAHFAMFLSPAAFLSLDSFFNKNKFINKRKAVVILSAIFLTFSASSFVVILLMSLVFLNRRYFIITIPFIVSIIVILLGSNFFHLRIMDSLGFIIGTQDISEVNLSTFALASNYYVTLQNIASNLFLGGGFGSHEFLYLKNFQLQSSWTMPLNYNDAGSLLLRIISELGLIGLLCLIYFLIKFYSRFDPKYPELNLISKMALTIIFVALLRNGHYFNYTFWVFIALYYYITMIKVSYIVKID